MARVSIQYRYSIDTDLIDTVSILQDSSYLKFLGIPDEGGFSIGGIAGFGTIKGE